MKRRPITSRVSGPRLNANSTMRSPANETASYASILRGRALIHPATIASVLAATLAKSNPQRRTLRATRSVVMSSTQLCPRTRQSNTAAPAASSAWAARTTRCRLAVSQVQAGVRLGCGRCGRWSGAEDPNVPYVDLAAARIHAYATHAIAAALKANVPVRAGGDVDPPIAVRVAVVTRRVALERTRDQTDPRHALTSARVDDPASDARERRGHRWDWRRRRARRRCRCRDTWSAARSHAGSCAGAYATRATRTAS